MRISKLLLIIGVLVPLAGCTQHPPEAGQVVMVQKVVIPEAQLTAHELPIPTITKPHHA